jgi:TDG/mug DNA glycosylase family protein
VTKERIAAAADGTLRDVLAPGVHTLFCGINPSLYSAAVGHQFARPGNRFWPALHDGGFTPRPFHPSEDLQLLNHGCGITNLASRATRRADELSRDELIEGAEELAAKVEANGVRVVAFLGVTAYRAAFAEPKAAIGRQTRRVGDAAVWVLPNPSGLNAHYQRPDFARLFGELRSAVADLAREPDVAREDERSAKA